MPESRDEPLSWGAVIRSLEADLERLRAGMSADGELPEGWSAPDIPGPLPEEYALQVRALIAAQREMMVALEGQRRAVSERIAAVRAAAATGPDAGAVYLDAEG